MESSVSSPTADPYVSLSQAELVAVLRHIADSVEAGDSYEGSLEYLAGDGERMFRVIAAYRIGQSVGQGGMRLIHAEVA
jgi:hypothetical protein